MTNKVIVIIGNYGNSEYINWLQSIDENFKIIEVKNNDDLKSISQYPDLLVFTGGADVNPDFYSENKGKYTHIDKNRDAFEIKAYNWLSNGVNHKLGICRGSQFLTVLSGGKLIQHVEGHNGSHNVRMSSGKNIIMTSDHHQMLYPFDVPKYNLLGWSERFLSPTYLNGNNQECELANDFLETEIVYYPNTRSLCIQGHPEYSHCENNASDECKKLVLSVLNNEL
jgi:GMP synthase-like glutamine amidotransferase